MIPCSVQGCDRKRDARGLCKGHWDWSKRHEWAVPTHVLGTVPTGPRRRRNVGEICSVEDCARPAWTGGMCIAHYNRARLKLRPPMTAPIRRYTHFPATQAELRDMLKTMTRLEIAQHLGVAKNSVGNWIRRYGLLRSGR